MGLFHLWCVSADHEIITGVTSSEKITALAVGLIIAGLLTVAGMNPTLAFIIGLFAAAMSAGTFRRQNRENPPQTPHDS